MSKYLLKSLPVIVTLLFVTCPFGYVVAQDTLRLTQTDAIGLALRQGREVEVARFDSSAADARWRATRDLWLPQLTLEATPYDFNHDWSARFTSDRITQNVTVNMSQSLPWGGDIRAYQAIGKYRIDYADTLYNDDSYYTSRRGVELQHPLLSGLPNSRERETATISRRLGQLSHESKLRDIEYEVTVAFFGLLQAQASYDIALRDLESGRSSADLAERKMNAGFIPEVELLQIQVDLARRESSVKDIEGSLETAIEDFRRKLNLPASTVPIPVFDAWADTLLPPVPPPPELETRPDVRQRKLQLRSSELAMKNSIAGKRIDLSLNAGYSSTGTVAEKFNEVLGGVSNEDSYVGLSLAMPIFGFGTTSAQIQASKAGYRSAEVNYRLQLEETAASQREAYRKMDRTADRIQIADKALTLSERSLAITEERFSNGLASSRDLLDAQLDMTRTRNEAVRARIDYHLSLAAIKRFSPGASDHPVND